MRLAGKVAIVTGAASGIGEAAAVRFGAEGAAVACVDRNEAGAAATAARINADGGRAISVGADVVSESDTQGYVAATLTAFGALHVLYSNAGVGTSGAAGDLSHDEWDRVIAINLTGVWLSNKHSLAPMIEAGGGSIINQASVGGLVGVPGIAAYAAAKAGVIGLTRQIAVEYGPRNIRANAICPGTVPTPLVRETYARGGGFAADPRAASALDSGFEAILNSSLHRYPLGRIGTVDAIANMALYLASDESNWTTGQALAVDGGMTAQ